MSTDPFANILRPVRGEYQEISQSTFVELISASREVIQPAYRKATPSVQNSLNRVAFGRACAGTTTDPSTPSAIIATPQRTQALSYALHGGAEAFHKQSAGLAAAKSSVDLRSMVYNAFDAPVFQSGVCPQLFNDPCISLPCPIDCVLVLNNTRVMMPVWDNVKQAIEDYVVYLAQTVRENIRLAIVTFQDFVIWHRRLDYTNVSDTKYQCIDALDGFRTVVRGLQMVGPYDGGTDVPDWSAQAVQFVLEGGVGSWRNARKLILLVSASPNNNDVVAYDIIAQEAASCNVMVSYIMVPAWKYFTPPVDPSVFAAMRAEGQKYSTLTGGPFIETEDDGTGILNKLQTWTQSLCTDTQQCPPDPNDLCAVDLAVIVDRTTSMADTINTIKNSIEGVIDILNSHVGNNIRLALVGFANIVTINYPFGTCGATSVAGFKEALGKMTLGGGIEYNALAVKTVAEGGAGAWREGVVRAILLVTDEENDVAAGNPTVTQAAQAAADNGIRIAYAAVPFATSEPMKSLMEQDGETYSTITNGISVGTNSQGDDLPSLLTTWIYGLCASTIPPRECEGGIDHTINGNFNTGIEGWSIQQPSVTWSSEKQAMQISGGGEARQTFTGLTAGDRMVLSASVETIQPGEITYGATSYSETTTIITGGIVRVTCSIDVPDNGEVTIFFSADSGDGTAFYLDSVVACVYKVDECGPGSRNLVKNPDFATGVQYWTDASGTSLPETDSVVWDSDVLAIIVNVSEYEEVRTIVDNVIPGNSYSLLFNILSSEPDEITEVSFEYGVLDSSNVVVAEGVKTNADMASLPITVSLAFTAPNDGIAKIFFKAGPIGGVTKVSSVLICEQTGLCEPGYNLLSFDDFTTSKGGWNGGEWSDGMLKIFTFAGGGYPSAGQLYTNLIPGSTVSVTLSVKTETSSTIEMYSGSVIDQVRIGPTLGQYTATSTVQPSGSMFIQINAGSDEIVPGRTGIYVDDILVCVSAPVICTNNATSVKSFVEWQGVPRRPFNIFNAIVRYDVRTFNGSTPVVTSYTYMPTTEAHLGIETCDFWKQEGNNGSVQSDTLRTGLNPLTIDSIADGDYASVATKANWLWSIPWNGTLGQDNLVINLPDPPTDSLVESVTIYLLSQYCTPSGSDTSPIYPGPLACGTDPATEVKVGISYINHDGQQREFSLTKHVNNLWPQSIDFEQNLPYTWDHTNSLGNGIKGDIARWDAYTFVLDAVNGTGLDQCSTPLAFSETATKGELTFSKFSLNGLAVFSTAPIILPVVPAGPYPYEIPVCEPIEDPCDLSSISCQSGPLLCRPGEGDVVEQPEACCDESTIPDSINYATVLHVERDLFDPYRSGCCGGQTTIRDLAVRKSLNPNNYVPYTRDCETGILSDADYSQTIKVGQSIVLIENELDTANGRSQVLGYLQTHREILPSRMCWTQGEFDVV